MNKLPGTPRNSAVAILAKDSPTSSGTQASLEEKHRHARETLEHYRAALKEQREQETRRHVEVRLDGAKAAITFEERLAKLDKAVFGTGKPGQPKAKAAQAD